MSDEKTTGAGCAASRSTDLVRRLEAAASQNCTLTLGTNELRALVDALGPQLEWPERAAVLRKAETAVDELTGDIIDGRISGIRAEYTQALIDGYCALRHSTPNSVLSDIARTPLQRRRGVELRGPRHP